MLVSCWSLSPFWWSTAKLGAECTRYNTISAYCADIVANPTGYRFILISTLVIGLSLASLHIQEYQSRTDHEIVLFAVELSACLALPFVGIFHTDGEGVNKYWMAFNSFRVPIWISVMCHYITALYYMTAMNVTNFYYAWKLLGKSNTTATELTPSAIAIIVLIFLACALFVTFIATQVVLNRNTPWVVWESFKNGFRICDDCKRCNCSCRCVKAIGQPTGVRCQFCHVTDDQRLICQHCGVDANWIVFYRNPFKHHKWLNLVSFWSEFSLIFVTTLAALLGTLRRNDQVPWLQ